MKEGYRALSACHTEALVQSACTEKNDEKTQRAHRAFALPRALINTIVSREMKVPCSPEKALGRVSTAPSRPALFPFSLFSSSPFLFHIPQAIIRLSFCTPLRFLFHLSLTPSRFSAKSFCFVL